MRTLQVLHLGHSARNLNMQNESVYKAARLSRLQTRRLQSRPQTHEAMNSIGRSQRHWDASNSQIGLAPGDCTESFPKQNSPLARGNTHPVISRFSACCSRKRSIWKAIPKLSQVLQYLFSSPIYSPMVVIALAEFIIT